MLRMLSLTCFVSYIYIHKLVRLGYRINPSRIKWKAKKKFFECSVKCKRNLRYYFLFSIFLLYSKYSILPHLQFDNGGWGKVHVKIAFSAHLRSLQYDYSNVLQYDLYEYTTIVDPGTYRYLHRTKYWIWNVRPVVGCGHHIMVVVLPDRNSWTNNPFYCADLPSDSVGE